MDGCYNATETKTSNNNLLLEAFVIIVLNTFLVGISEQQCCNEDGSLDGTVETNGRESFLVPWRRAEAALLTSAGDRKVQL